MGYHVTIFRTKEKQLIPITREEVINLVESTADLEIIKELDKELEITTKAPDLTGPLFIWQDGVIWTKTPLESTIQ